MTLAEWQNHLVDLLTIRVGGEPVGVAATPGFALTRRVQREWRAFRIRSSLPLTCRLLGCLLDRDIDDYLDDVIEPSSFFLREAEQFVAHHHSRWGRSDVPHVAAVSHFELAMLRGVQERARPQPESLAYTPNRDDVVAAHPAADVIRFAAPPQLVLLSAATGDPPPPSKGVHLLLCTPTTCRLATTAEYVTFDWVRAEPRPAGTLAAHTLRSLTDAGALVVVGRRRERMSAVATRAARTDG